MMNEYDNWNEIKKIILIRETNSFPVVGEVWMCSLGKNVGYGQNGVGERFFRPVFVIKKFNTRMFWIIPLSTKQKELDFYHNFNDPYNKKVSVILAQLKLISVKRFERKIYTIQNELMTIIKNKLHTLTD